MAQAPGGGKPDLDEVRVKLELACAYAEMGDEEGARELIDEVLREGDQPLQAEARRLRTLFGDRAGLEAFRDAFRKGAATHGDPDASALARALAFPDAEILRAVLLAIRSQGGDWSAAAGKALAAGRYEADQLAFGLHALGRLVGAAAIARLPHHGKKEVEQGIALALGRLGDAPRAQGLEDAPGIAQQALAAYLGETHEQFGMMMLRGLCARPHDEAAFFEAIDGWPREMRASLIEFLGRRGDARALGALDRQWARGNERAAVAKAAVAIGGDRGARQLVDWLRHADAKGNPVLREVLTGAAEPLRSALACALEADEELCASAFDLYAGLRGSAALAQAMRLLRSRLRAVRDQAVAAIVAICAEGKGEAPVPALLGMLAAEGEAPMREAILACLAGVPDARAVKPLADVLAKGGREERQLAAAALARIPGADALSALGAATDSPQWRVRLAAANGLGTRREAIALRALVRLAADPHPAVRAAAEAAMTTLRLRLTADDLPALREMSASPEPALAACARRLAEELEGAARATSVAAKADAGPGAAATLEAMCAAFGRHLGAARVTLYEVAGDAIESVVLPGLDLKRTLKLPIDKSSIAGFVAATRCTVNVADAYDERELAKIDPGLRFLAEVDRRTGFRTRQVLAAPIVDVASGKLLGVLQALNRDGEGAFPPEAVQAIGNFCHAFRPELARRRGGDLPPANPYRALVEDGILSAAEWELAERTARKRGLDVDTVLAEDFKVPLAVIGAALARHHRTGYRGFDAAWAPPRELAKNLRREFSESSGWLPLGEEGGGIVVACVDPDRTRLSGIVGQIYPKRSLVFTVTTWPDFRRMLDRVFGEAADEGDIGDLLGALDSDEPDVAPPADASRTVPAPIRDEVYFTATAPKRVAAGASFVLDVWAHLEGDREAVLARAREERPGEALRAKTKGSAAIERGKVLAVRVSIADFGFEDEDAMRWTGRAGNCTFGVPVPAGAAAGRHVGVARFAVDGVPVSRLHFELEVGEADTARGDRSLSERRPSSAFASYASEDRDEVLARIQGMQKLLPDLDVFLDIASLRAGENWSERLEREIAERDAFFLFWSGRAARSEWVEREWRMALRLKGLEAIDPVPLEPPAKAPPPRELGALHFNEWTLAYRSGPSA